MEKIAHLLVLKILKTDKMGMQIKVFFYFVQNKNQPFLNILSQKFRKIIKMQLAGYFFFKLINVINKCLKKLDMFICE